MNVLDPDTRTGLREALQRDAGRLAQGQRCPIDLFESARALNLSIRLDPSLPSEGALVQERGRSVIVIGGPGVNRQRQRFTVAHEIGHHLLDVYGLSRPQTPKEYWLVENLCHFFAGCLLIPNPVISWVRAAEPNEPHHLLTLAMTAMERADVSAAAISHRLRDELPGTAFCEVSYSRSSESDVSGIVRWVAERFPWLRAGAKRKLRADHFLSRLMHAHRQSRYGAITLGYMNGLPVAGVRRTSSVWVVCLDRAQSEEHSTIPDQLGLPWDLEQTPNGLACSI